MTNYIEILSHSPYSLKKHEKSDLLSNYLCNLTKHHYEKSKAYRAILDAYGFDLNQLRSYTELPFIPVSLFKSRELRSIPNEDIFKTMTSSGTTGQAVSKIYLDRMTAANQQKTLAKIVGDFIGRGRMPMLVIDCPSVVRDRVMFSARGAGILGFSIFGSDVTYALNDDMQLDLDAVQSFIQKHSEKKILIFGFTFMIWQHFCKALRTQGIRLNLSNTILIHGGGWKKLLSEAVSPEEFAVYLNEVASIPEVHDYYGMVEQTGCIYMQCECGHLHASVYSDIIIRRAHDFSICDISEPGIIQVLSLLPESYPGHSLLTEDEGVLLGEDDCSCGRFGKYFKVNGRLKNVEIRGCSDTYADQFTRG